MKVFDIPIPIEIADFFNSQFKSSDFIAINQILEEKSGIVNFFENKVELKVFEKPNNSSDRTEYGDFQTPKRLCNLTCKLLQDKQIQPQIIIEPTCGQGTFIISALEHFENIEKIIGIEIYPKYVWETKLAILNYFLINPERNKPEIQIINKSVFDVDFKEIATQNADKEILIIGNPPWVTNAQLSVLHSANLPQKSNFKNQKGIDAITGKGNFDIAENICLTILNHFASFNGYFAFLQKNIVTKSIVLEQIKNKYSISDIEQYNFDAKKEFNVATAASLFYCRFNQQYGVTCNEFDLYEPKRLLNQFGWSNGKFVANLNSYSTLNQFDGVCPFVWRQGIKHDCSKVMELEKVNDFYRNGNGENVEIEEELVFNLLKSSDLKTGIINESRKYIIATQTKVGESTDYIELKYPKTFQYLSLHIEKFRNRKSVIYKNKPDFSIFGVGDYSFKKYKVAISGFYKATQFALVLPNSSKSIQLDDTCYFIGFDRLEFAVFTYIVLNHSSTQHFLHSIIFFDGKRPITKDILMRIDLLKLADNIHFKDIIAFYSEYLSELKITITLRGWTEFQQKLIPATSERK